MSERAWKREHLPGRGRLALSASRATKVDLVVEGQDPVPMERSGTWWVAPEPVPDGVRYRFSVDGEDPVPDPRALARPDGVHGPSVTWTPPATAHPDAGCLLGKVFYELHVGTFTEEGTFEAAIDRLDHLVELGAEVIELMPVAAFPGRYGWGYDGVGIYAAHAGYGGPEGLSALIKAAHQRGLAVCLDLVLNHLGPVGNYLGKVDQYYSTKHETPWGPAFDLDGENAEHTREFLVGAALYWLVDMGFDALRLDAIHALIDDSERHLLAELSDAVAYHAKETGRTLTLIAESDLNDPQVVTPTDRGGLGMDAQWDDDLHHALHALFTGEDHGYYGDFANAEALSKAYEDVFVHNGTYSTFRERTWGRPVDPDLDRRRFFIFTQNHDQVGNRALGDRPSRALTRPQLAAQAALSLLSPFTPMLFQGEEWGSRAPFLFFSDQEGDEDMARAMREGRQREFASHGWDRIYGGPVQVPDPTSEDTFAKSRLDWASRSEAEGQEMLAWYRRLIEIRRTQPALTDGKPVTMHWDGELLTMRRASHDAPVVTVNFGEAPAPLEAREVLANSGDYLSPATERATAPATDPAVDAAGAAAEDEAAGGIEPGGVAVYRP